MTDSTMKIKAGTCATCRHKPKECCLQWGGFVADEGLTCEKYEAKAVEVLLVNEKPKKGETLALF